MAPCGVPMLLSVRGQQPEVGIFEIANDSTKLRLRFTCSERYRLVEGRVHVSAAKDLPRRENGMPDSDRFGIRSALSSPAKAWEYEIPLTDPAACLHLAARMELQDLQDPERPTTKGWAMDGQKDAGLSFDYCPRSCKRTRLCQSAGAGDFQTLPVAAWADPASEWELRLKTEFDALFPDGFLIGCAREFRWREPEPLLALLRGGRTLTEDGALPEGMDPKAANKLAVQTIALQLAIALDHQHPDFCAAEAPLESLEVAKGTFRDWSIKDLLTEVHTLLGDCATNYSPRQLTEALIAINRNFAQSDHHDGFLVCPETTR